MDVVKNSGVKASKVKAGIDHGAVDAATKEWIKKAGWIDKTGW